MPQISSFLISMLFISLVVIVFSGNMSQLSQNYGITYDNSSMVAMNKMEALANQTAKIDQSATDLNAKSSATDLIGSLFTNAYSVLIVMKDSFSVFASMVDVGFNTISFGVFGQYYKQFLILVVIIIIVIGVLVTSIIKNRI